jgi:hypothetical protein
VQQARAQARLAVRVRAGREQAQLGAPAQEAAQERPVVQVPEARAQEEPGLQARAAQERPVVQVPEARAQEEPGLQARAAQVAVAPVLRAVARPAWAQPVRQPSWATRHWQTLDRLR